jgi:hypothetical protein
MFGKTVISERVRPQDHCGTRPMRSLTAPVLAMFWARLRTPCRVGRDSSNHALQIV